MKWTRVGRAAIGALLIALPASACGPDANVPGAQGSGSEPDGGSATSIEADAQPTTGDVRSNPTSDLELDLVPPASVPLVLFEYLDTVQLAVRQDVGDTVFGGAVVERADSYDVTITIYGTDVNRLTDVVDRIAADERDRITVVESDYSVSGLDGLAAEAQRRLDAERIEAYVASAWGRDAVEVGLVTPNGSPDPALEAAARVALGELPVVVTFTSPVVPLVPVP